VTTTEIPETPYPETEALLAVIAEDESVADILSEMNPNEVHALGQAANRLYRLCAVEYALRRQRAFAAGHPLPAPQWGI
jgi:hypothetical protein